MPAGDGIDHAPHTTWTGSRLRVEINPRLDALTALTSEKPDADKPQAPDIKETTKGGAKTAKPDTGSPRAAEAHARLTSIAKAIDELRASLFKVDDDGATPLAGLLRAEALATIAEGAHVLQLKVETAGGATNIKEGEVRSNGARFSGGVVVQFVLFDPSSRIVHAATLWAYSGLRGSDETAPVINLIDVED